MRFTLSSHSCSGRGQKRLGARIPSEQSRPERGGTSLKSLATNSIDRVARVRKSLVRPASRVYRMFPSVSRTTDSRSRGSIRNRQTTAAGSCFSTIQRLSLHLATLFLPSEWRRTETRPRLYVDKDYSTVKKDGESNCKRVKNNEG